MPKWDVAAQGTAGWLKARCGVLTASRMADVMAFSKKGEPLEARKKYMVELLAERMADQAAGRYVTPAMEWGIVTEPEARAKYEELTGVLVEPCGFALHDTIEFCGASPDGLIGHDGLLEIKCPTTSTHIAWKLEGVVPQMHKPQMLLQLAVTGRKWCDFMSYDPRVPAPVDVLLWRFTPTAEEIAEVEDAARNFLMELDELWEKLTLE